MNKWCWWYVVLHCLSVFFCMSTANVQGRNHGWKVEGDQGLGPNTGPRKRPAPGQRPRWVLGAGGVARPPACAGPGYHPLKILENSDAKSCILLWNFLLFENYGQEVGRNQYIVGPQPKSWGNQPPPVPTVVAPMLMFFVCCIVSVLSLSVILPFWWINLFRWLLKLHFMFKELRIIH